MLMNRIVKLMRCVVFAAALNAGSLSAQQVTPAMIQRAKAMGATQEQIDAALEGLDPAFVAALEKAAHQIREFHQREVEQSWFTTRPDGTMLGVKVTPLAAAGIYVPGGRL